MCGFNLYLVIQSADSEFVQSSIELKYTSTSELVGRCGLRAVERSSSLGAVVKG